MIYLSGAMQADKIGQRKDIGVMIAFRPKKDWMGHTKRFDRCFWAADNGCFTNSDLNVDDYLAWLKTFTLKRRISDEDEREYSTFENCLFAVAPDVVGDPVETWARSEPVLPKIRELGYFAAFVAQDGQENLPIHWDRFDCLFIGGSTEWKCSDASFWLIREALKRGKQAHVGRVNSLTRIRWAALAGATSCDGTTIAFAPDKKLPQVEGWLDVIRTQRTLSLYSDD